MEIKARGFTFDVTAGGPADGTPVLLLHGFPQDAREWDLMAPRLHDAGLRTYAVNQRGYSPGARPEHVADYRLSELRDDAVAVLDALNVDSAHVIGHDWGAQVGWLLAADRPERVRSLTAVSVPHPRALRLALRVRPSQRARMAYMKGFMASGSENVLLAANGRLLRSVMRRLGDRAGQYADAMREPGRLTAALNWYRAIDGRLLAEVGTIAVPTTYVWTDRDPVIGRTAALRTADWVDADYELVVIRGVGHWVPEEAPRTLADVALRRMGV